MRLGFGQGYGVNEALVGITNDRLLRLDNHKGKPEQTMLAIKVTADQQITECLLGLHTLGDLVQGAVISVT